MCAAGRPRCRAAAVYGCGAQGMTTWSPALRVAMSAAEMAAMPAQEQAHAPLVR